MREKKRKRVVDEPTMSDKTLLVNVEDLINRAFGSLDQNTVNFTLLQSILYILARQVDMLEQDVEIKFDELGIEYKTLDELEVDDDRTKADGRAKSRGRVGVRSSQRRHEPHEVGSIQLITASQFAPLEGTVNRLLALVTPLPTPSMPDNAQLRKDLAKGRASLTDTMQAMQLSARMQGAEHGLARMTELLAQLATMGLLPEDVTPTLGKMRVDLIKASQKPGSDDELGADSSVEEALERPTKESLGRPTKEALGRVTEQAFGRPTEEALEGGSEVTRQALKQHIQFTKEEITKKMEDKFAYPSSTANSANKLSLNISDKLDIALKINHRIDDLSEQTDKNVLQLREFDAGVKPQMAMFQEGMESLKHELATGLALFLTANNSAEAAALVAIDERCDHVTLELESTIHHHKNLDHRHAELCEEIKNVVDCVEMLCEQKADRDEVTEGLTDKADLKSLAGMMQETDFAEARITLEQSIAKSHEEFHKLDSVWHYALKDLMCAVDTKAEYVRVVGFKKNTEEELTKDLEYIRRLEALLGEPEAAILMRRISEGAACGACLTRALIEPKDRTHGKPLALPALRPPPREPAAAAPALSPPDFREHTCHRWVGGSHTLLTKTVAREKPSIKLQLVPTRKYAGYGCDGRLYMMEEDVQPCEECKRDFYPGNVSPQVSTPTDGGGDQAFR